jgi:hypothetical protein
MMNLSTLLLLLLSLSAPAAAEANRGNPTPERVYRQLRQEPAIRTREEALELLSGASPGDLWRSAKLAVDERIKEVLSQAGFGSLDGEVQSKLHAGMLEIRASFWEEDLEKLSAAGEELREIWESGGIAAEAESPVDAEGLRDRLLALVEEVEIAVAVQRCARRQPHLEPVDALDCVLRGGPGN